MRNFVGALLAWHAGDVPAQTEPVSATLNFRPRYEYVSQQGSPEDAHALTLRTIAGVSFTDAAPFSGLVEIIDVSPLTRRFNDTRNAERIPCGSRSRQYGCEPGFPGVERAFEHDS